MEIERKEGFLPKHISKHQLCKSCSQLTYDMQFNEFTNAQIWSKAFDLVSRMVNKSKNHEVRHLHTYLSSCVCHLSKTTQKETLKKTVPLIKLFNFIHSFKACCITIKSSEIS